MTEWLTTQEVAAALRLAPKTIRGMIDRGELRASKVAGGRWRIPATAVENYMTEREVAPRPPVPDPAPAPAGSGGGRPSMRALLASMDHAGGDLRRGS